jgi:hypothetical protein
VVSRADASLRDALETTLAVLDLPFEAAAHVALCRLTADRIDTIPLHIDAYATVCNSYMRQIAELRQWVKQPELPPTEDPFDALTKALSKRMES